MKLPIIKRFLIERLSLYTQPIEQTMYPGINMVIGGNGIGKTTLINTVLFGLFGNAPYEKLNAKTGRVDSVVLVDKEYFKGRIDPQDQDFAQVMLTIGIGSYDITVTRALYRPRILRLEIQDNEKSNIQTFDSSQGELEDIYQDAIQRLLEIEQFEHFVFLVSNLLVFGEERNTLVWDTEIQNRVIRLISLDREFDKRFDDLSEKGTKFDTTARHMSETRKDIRNAIDRWLKQKNEALGESIFTSDEEKENLEIRLAELQTEIDRIEEKIAEIKVSLEDEVAQLKTYSAEMDRLELTKIPLLERLEEFEKAFYSNIYQNVPPQYIVTLEALIKQGTCQLCGTKGVHLKNLGLKLKEEGRCIVCRSSVNYSQESTSGEAEDNLAVEINKLRTQIEKLDSDQKTYIQAQTSSNIEIKRIQETITQKSRDKNRLETEKIDLKSKFITSTESEPFSDPRRDEWLDKQNREIIELDSQIETLYRKRDEARSELQILNDELIQVLHRINEELTRLFSHFASRFLGTDCELVISQKTKVGKPIAYMYPRFHSKDREGVTQVSESQRFFLDQAFRMALITWFTQASGQQTFYIVETPEGSLDLAYEKNVADMYIEFGSYGHSIIVTSNLNSSNFLGGLYDQLGEKQEKEKRTLDLLKYGRLSSVQKQQKHLKNFNERIHQLGLPFIWPNENDTAGY
ncbi:MAG: hypothetical protein EXR62_05205 [Chloroflexi bacterium]|nr:hypothetical protein [Chloroflexota bacterium]